jgi:hypothetical protein
MAHGWSKSLRYLLTIAATAGCGLASEDARQVEIVNVMTSADESLILTRPRLVASKYRQMAQSPYGFMRGSFPLYNHDVTTNAWGLPASRFYEDVSPFSVGDAHVENFGFLLGRSGELSLQPNDLDGADRYNYLLEVRRLATALLVGQMQAQQLSTLKQPVSEPEPDAAFALAYAYAEEIAVLAGDEERAGELSPGVVFEDLLERATEDRDARAELAELTVIEGDQRRLLRGPVDNDDPENVYLEPAPLVWELLPDVLMNYRTTLQAPPPAGYFAIKDVVREIGSGVASRARLRLIVLVEGESGSNDDDLLLEVKELGDSGVRPAVFTDVSADSVTERIQLATEVCFAGKDAAPLWGTSSLAGLNVQVRLESKAEKSFRVARLIEELGTPSAIADLGRLLGRALARIHAGTEQLEPGTLARLQAAMQSDPEGFADEQAQAAQVMAEGVFADHARFVDALATLGPTLGLSPRAEDALRGEAGELAGDPPELP